MAEDDLFEAISRHDVPGIAGLLARGVDPNRYLAQPPYWHPLEAAIEELERGASMDTVKRMVTTLLRYGANVNAWDPEHTLTPLLKAIYFPMVGPDEARSSELIRLLLDAGADANVESDDGLTPLKYAVGREDVDLVAAMLKSGAGKTINKVTGHDGWNALHLAAADLNVPIIRQLLQAGADPEIPDKDRMKAVSLLPRRDDGNQKAWDEAYALLKRENAKTLEPSDNRS